MSLPAISSVWFGNKAYPSGWRKGSLFTCPEAKFLNGVREEKSIPGIN
jgi:uncharacterized protein YifE (UPF0438 family)